MVRLLCMAIMVIITLSPALAEKQATAQETQSVFDIMADKLLGKLEVRQPEPQKKGLISQLADRFKKPKNIIKHGPPRVAIWPFDRAQIPVPKSLARSWNDLLLDALVSKSSGYLRFKTRTDIATLIKEVDGTNISGEIKNPVAAVVGKAKVDILIIGKMLSGDGGVELSYMAVDMGGTILATTGGHFMELDLGTPQDSLTLDAAVASASDFFTDLGPELKRLRVQGLRFGDSGVQTSFGRFFTQQLTDAIQSRMNNDITDFRLKVVDAVIEQERLRKLRGMEVTAKEIDGMLAGEKKGDYLLTGNYWDFGRHVQLRIAIRNNKGEGLAWNRHIHKASIPPGLELVPKNPWELPSQGDNHGYGPINLELTSNKGFNPVFRIKEKMILLIHLSEDAFLNCFYKQANGIMFKIFPNKFKKSSRFEGWTQLQIPSDEMPFDFTVSPPPGVELLRCFALDRDVTAKLPPEIANSDMAPIPAKIGDRLTRIYRGIPDTKVTEVSMVVTVEE